MKILKLAIVYGTRPEIIKLAELMKLCEGDPGIAPMYIHTGQHYSYNMNRQFLEELKLPLPHVNLEVRAGTHAGQTGQMMMKLEDIFLQERPDVLIVQGDTNSVLAGALAAVKLHIPVGHVEAGIRSFDRKMPEEVNRVIADQVSEFCFAPTEIAVDNLKKEGKKDSQIYPVGNTIVEVTTDNLEIAENNSILEELGLEREEYFVLTMHRAENVDNEERLKNVIDAIAQLELPIVYPIHPRTLKGIKQFGLYPTIKKMTNLSLIAPLGYLAFLKLCANSKLIITDSGGIQEECTIYKRPVLVIRDSTERPEALGTFTWLVGCDKQKIVDGYQWIMSNYSRLRNRLSSENSPFGDGMASKRILAILRGENEWQMLS